ncbi:16361_t:CDS:2, partial [Cetraspora pellucida]
FAAEAVEEAVAELVLPDTFVEGWFLMSSDPAGWNLKLRTPEQSKANPNDTDGKNLPYKRGDLVGVAPGYTSKAGRGGVLAPVPQRNILSRKG